MNNNHTIEVTVSYRMGHQRFVTRCAIIGRNIARIEEVPLDVPENTDDGCMARIQLTHGEMLLVKESYDKLLAAWQATLDSL